MLNSPHVQTLWAPLLRPKPKIERRAEKFLFSDGDHCWLYWAGWEHFDSNASVVVLFHGLSGSASSLYVLCLQRLLTSLGLTSVAVNYRGAGGKPNDKAINYHAGETQDLQQLFAHWQTQWPALSFAAVGFSLGGSRLLNFLSEAQQPRFKGAITVCVPLDLEVCEAKINQGFSKVYRNHLLSGLVADMTGKLAHLAKVAPAEADKLLQIGNLKAIKTFREYDDRVVSTLYGFAGAGDYYQRCSALPKLKDIKNNVVLIQAPDDPFMTPEVLPKPDELSASVRLITRNGGHVGFVEGLPLQPRYWLEATITELLCKFNVFK